jgi:hypothetical protein
MTSATLAPGNAKTSESSLIIRPRQLILDRGETRRRFPSGFVARILRHCEEWNVPLEIVSTFPPNPRLIANAQVLADFSPHDQQGMQTLLQERCGQIVANQWAQRMRWIALAARVYAIPAAAPMRISKAVSTSPDDPDDLSDDLPENSYVAVITGSRQVARQAAHDLRRLLGRDNVDLNIEGIVRSQTPVQVCTFSYVDTSCADLTFYLDATEAVTKQGRFALWGFGDDRQDRHYNDQHVYGFVPWRLEKRVHAFELEGILGPIIHDTDEPDRRRTPVTILRSRPPQTRDPNKSKLEAKRIIVWHNLTRNQHIAQLASAACAGLDGLEKLIGQLPQSLVTHAPPLRVAVLVEVPEHGRELTSLLKGWRLLSRDDLSPDLELPDRAVITHLFAAHCPHLNFDVLIRADGDGELPAMLGFPPQSRSGSQRSVWLLEPADGHTARRIESYRQRGWT